MSWNHVIVLILGLTYVCGRVAIDADFNVLNNSTGTKDANVPRNTSESGNSENTSNATLANSDEIDNEIDTEDPRRDPDGVDYSPLILTKYINEGRLDEARIASKVDPSVFLGVKSYSGYLTVNSTYNSNLFFWYFPVEDKPLNSTPWIVWLQGGPGASSMSGLFDEIGPISIDRNQNLIKNPYTWLRNHSLVFIDNPVGTGFSFTDSPLGYVTDMDTYGSHLHEAVKQLALVFTELQAAPLFIAGESYAGKYVPALAIQIHRHNTQPTLNMQGLILGNAFVDPKILLRLVWPYYYFGLLTMEQLEALRPLVDAFNADIIANRSELAKNKWNNLILLLLAMTNQKHAYNFLQDQVPVGWYVRFLRRPEVARALHVGSVQFEFLNVTVNYKLAPDFLSSTKPLCEELLNHYKILAYCGHLDLMMSCVLTSESYRTWRWDHSEQFLKAQRYSFEYDNSLAGYYKSGGGLSEAVIRGAGHMAPQDRPRAVRRLVTRHTHALPMTLVRDLDYMQLSRFMNITVANAIANANAHANATNYML